MEFDFKIDWTETMNSVFKNLKELNMNIDISQIKSIVESNELNDGFSDIFEFLSLNKNSFESIIISGSNILFVDWVTKKHNIDHIFTKFYSNKAFECKENIIKLHPTHKHDCEICNPAQCKNKVLSEFLNENKKINKFFDRKIYIGDGENDYCPSKLFHENDYLCARENYKLDKMVKNIQYENKLNIKFNFLSWKNGHDVLRLLRKFK
jgi:2,3-diketo-5-methylthio-1-phosphopentane phosphatase